MCEHVRAVRGPHGTWGRGRRVERPLDRQLLAGSEGVAARRRTTGEEAPRSRHRDITPAQVGEAPRAAAEVEAAAAAPHVDRVLDGEIPLALPAGLHDHPTPVPRDGPPARVDGSAQGHIATRADLGEASPEAPRRVEDTAAHHVEERIQ